MGMVFADDVNFTLNYVTGVVGNGAAWHAMSSSICTLFVRANINVYR